MTPPNDGPVASRAAAGMVAQVANMVMLTLVNDASTSDPTALAVVLTEAGVVQLSQAAGVFARTPS